MKGFHMSAKYLDSANRRFLAVAEVSLFFYILRIKEEKE